VDTFTHRHSRQLDCWQNAKQAQSHNNLTYNIPLGVKEIYSITHRNILDTYKTQLSTNRTLISKIKPNPCTKPLNCHANIHYDKIITRLRVEKTNLLGNLAQYTRHTSNNCTHCQIPETITHYLLNCPQHDLHRSNLKQTKALSTDYRPKFTALHRQWWRLHISEIFLSGT
jgi:hypothetical protein